MADMAQHSKKPKPPKRRFFRRRPVVSVLRLEGVIAPGRGAPFRAGSLNLNGLQELIDKAFRPARLAAVVLQINSPGGSPVQSALIAAAIRRRAAEKNTPVLAFAEDVAASGGYWLLAAGDEVFAHDASIIGSIGVISASFGFHELLQRHGVERRVHTAGERKLMLDPFSPSDENDIQRLKGIQARIHTLFIDWVKQRRGARLSETRGDDIFSGDVFLGREAHELGLIDHLGAMDDVLRERFGDEARIARISSRSSPLKRMLGGMGGGIGSGMGGGAPDLAASIAAEAESRLLWSRFGQ